jgi:hypothetical protein
MHLALMVSLFTNLADALSISIGKPKHDLRDAGQKSTASLRTKVPLEERGQFSFWDFCTPQYERYKKSTFRSQFHPTITLGNSR